MTWNKKVGRKPGPVGVRNWLSRSALVTLLMAMGCLYPPRPPYDDASTTRTPLDLPPLPSGPALRVLVLGDFGTGGEGQAEVARAIAHTHAADRPHFVLTVGDNFYPEGVRSVEDPLWQSVFEAVYSGEFWDGLVFYPSLGNHDIKGDEAAQIRYSERSPRWAMPERYHTFRRALPEGDTVRFLMLDTNALHRGGEAARPQLEWVDSVLGVSRDPWVIAYGHHPIMTGGWHGASDAVGAAITPRFQDRVPLFLSGHNHSTELLQVTESLAQAVCGGGGGLDNPYRVDVLPQTLAAFSNGGWCFLRIWPDTLAVELYNRVGTLAFRHIIAGHSGSS